VLLSNIDRFNVGTMGSTDFICLHLIIVFLTQNYIFMQFVLTYIVLLSSHNSFIKLHKITKLGRILISVQRTLVKKSKEVIFYKKKLL